MSFAVHVTFAASGTSPFTLRVAQPGDKPLTAKKVLKAFAAAYAKKTGEALDVASLGLRADAKASTTLAPADDVRRAVADGGAVFVVRAAAPALADAVVGRSALGVSLAQQVTQALNWSVRQATELEANLVAHGGIAEVFAVSDAVKDHTPSYWDTLEGCDRA